MSTLGLQWYTPNLYQIKSWMTKLQPVMPIFNLDPIDATNSTATIWFGKAKPCLVVQKKSYKFLHWLENSERHHESCLHASTIFLQSLVTLTERLGAIKTVFCVQNSITDTVLNQSKRFHLFYLFCFACFSSYSSTTCIQISVNWNWNCNSKIATNPHTSWY